MSRGLNWTDLLNQELDYVVLRKDNRLQILFRPGEKQLRRRGKRKWTLVAAVHAGKNGNGEAGVPHELRDAILQSLLDLTSSSTPAPKKARKPKKVKEAKA